MENINDEKLNILGPLLANNTHTRIREHFMLDANLQHILQNAKSQGGSDEVWNEVAEQAVDLMKRYPAIIDVQSIAKATNPAGFSTARTESSPTAALAQGKNIRSITQHEQKELKRARDHVRLLRGRIKKNNMAMLSGARPKTHSTEKVHRGMGGPRQDDLERLFDIIDLQISLYRQIDGVRGPSVILSMKDDLERFSAVNYSWYGRTDVEYERKLKKWIEELPDALGGKGLGEK